MEQPKTYRPPKKELARMQVVRFGKILFNLQFLALVVMLASILSFIFPVIYYLVLIFIMLITCFSIFAIVPDFASWWSGGEKFLEIAIILFGSWMFTVPIALIVSVGSIVCLCFDKNQKHVARIVVSSIIAVVAVIILIFKIINGGLVV